MAKRITVDVPDWAAAQAVELLKERMPLLLGDPRTEPLLPEPEDLVLEYQEAERDGWADDDRVLLALDDDRVSLTPAGRAVAEQLAERGAER